MARRKQEIALQSEIETQEEWEEMLAKEGLTVVDIYQEWAGPCKAMVSNFRRLKNELGDDMLRFAIAKADTVDSLEGYRHTCKPCFLYFAGGVLVAVVRGCNSPLLLKTITEQLAHEHKVLEGNAERKEIRDPLLATKEKVKQEEEEEEDDEVGAPEIKKDVTVAIIKPDVVEAGRVEEVLQTLKEAGIEILEHIERTITEDEARKLYEHRKDEPYFEGLVQYMTGGPSHFLVITKGETGEGVIEEFRDLIGPAQVEEAKENAPESLRSKFGKEDFMNAIHGADSRDAAARELALFFPGFEVPVVPGTRKQTKTKTTRRHVQRTLALIRPDAMAEKKDEILAKIKEAGFTVAMAKEVQLSEEQAKHFYREHEGQEYYDELVNRMCNGPLLALALAREDAVTQWRSMLGPKEVEKAKEEAPESLRAQFAVDNVAVNQLHGSDSIENAKKELNFFFPVQKTLAVIKPEAMKNKDEIMDKIKEAGFHVAARKETHLTQDMAETFYKDHEGKEYYGDLVNHMTDGPTLFMVLSKHDAVDGWRAMIGPTDPDKAKEENPDSLRAKFGTNTLANALHGSSNPEDAEKAIKMLFKEDEFEEEEDTDTEQTEEEPKPKEESQKGGEEKKTDEVQQDSGEREAEAAGKVADDDEQAEKPSEEKEPTQADDSEQQQPAAEGGETAEEKPDDTKGEGGEDAPQQADEQNTAPSEEQAEVQQSQEETPGGGAEETKEGGAEETKEGGAEETKEGEAEETKEGGTEETKEDAAEETKDGGAEDAKEGGTEEAGGDGSEEKKTEAEAAPEQTQEEKPSEAEQQESTEPATAAETTPETAEEKPAAEEEKEAEKAAEEEEKGGEEEETAAKE